MKNFLYLMGVVIIFSLSACSDTESANQHYAVEQKKQIEIDLNESIKRNMEKLESQKEY